MPAAPGDDVLRATLAAVAPGTMLRDGLERILRGNTGGLVVLGYDDVVESLCTGGFELDVEFSATRLRELSKMDGAVVLSTDQWRGVRAAGHLGADPTIPTDEARTPHPPPPRGAPPTGDPATSRRPAMRGH